MKLDPSKIKSTLQNLVQKEERKEGEKKEEKMKPTRATEESIPRGRPLSDSESDGEHRPSEREKNVVIENGIKFSKGGIPSHHHVQLTTFWANRMQKVRGYVPVSMFTRAWLNENLETENRKPIRKKARKDEEEDSDEEKFEGNSYPMELRLTYGDWVSCFTLMVDYIRNWCKHKELALGFEQHMKNVQQIKSENDDNWMIALRYDITVRRQIWTTRVEDGSVPDPAVRQ
ncbi:hypothetical protein DFH28DRAFT_894609, partial [Melampsora americana]